MGAVAVEAVFVLPVMLAVTFGAIEFGIAYNQKGNLEAATRAGARLGATEFSITENAGNTQLAENVLQAVNAALKSGTTPHLTALFVYRGTSLNGCASDCVSFPVDPSHQDQFLDTPSGQWPASTTPGGRTGCGPTPDKISVQIQSTHQVLTALLPFTSMNISSTSTLQFEPNNC